jgi:hypothetical protein
MQIFSRNDSLIFAKKIWFYNTSQENFANEEKGFFPVVSGTYLKLMRNEQMLTFHQGFYQKKAPTVTNNQTRHSVKYMQIMQFL